jgi:type I restriction enzyme S subunit
MSPSDWLNRTVGDLVTLQRGIDLPDAERGEGQIPIMGSFGVTGRHNKAACTGPGVTVGRSGASVGVVSYIEKDYWPLNTCLYVRDFHGNNPRFAYYFLKTLDLARLNSGSAQPSLNRNFVHPVPITFPARREQDAIASILGALDDKIALNRRMNETLEAMARAIFKDWFVDFGPTRVKMEDRAPYLAPEVWALFPDRLDGEGKPEGWKSETVLPQANWINGAAYKNMHFVEPALGLPVVKIAELKSGVTPQTKFTNTDLGDRYRIKDGEILFSWSGNPDTSIDTFIWTGGPAWLNQHIFAVRENGRRKLAYVYTMLKWLNPVFAELARNKQTTGLGHVTKEDLGRLQVVVPSPPIELEFDRIVGPILDRLRGTLFENRALAATHDALLPKLMSGEVRVKDAERIAEAAL